MTDKAKRPSASIPSVEEFWALTPDKLSEKISELRTLRIRMKRANDIYNQIAAAQMVKCERAELDLDDEAIAEHRKKFAHASNRSLFFAREVARFTTAIKSAENIYSKYDLGDGS